MLHEGFFDRRKSLTIRWGNLPHWRQDGALYFVTFRLSDSLPKERLDEMRRMRSGWLDSHPNSSRTAIEQFSLEQRERIEHWLDQEAGSCVLRLPAARSIVEQTIEFFEGERYELGERAVAPNHVHTLVRTASGVDLSSVLHSWKRRSSEQLRKIPEVAPIFPKGKSRLWQTESFDHIVRGQKDLERYWEYIGGHRSE